MNEKLWYHKLLNLLVAFTLAFSSVMVFAPVEPVLAANGLTVTPITWDVVGLDHNRPATSGPELFPVGARVCNTSETTISDVEVEMVWTESDVTYIITRPGSQTKLTFDEIGSGECVDAYFEIQLTREPGSFGQSRGYTIVASYDDNGTPVEASTPAGRQIYIERLVSQNRNSTTQIRYCDPSVAPDECDQDKDGDWTVLGGGGSINMAVGNTYFIELTTETATAYEQLQSFLTLSNTIFQILSVETTYTDQTAPADRVPEPNPQLWADGCLWDSDPSSDNYNSCLDTGKAGGIVTTLYEIRIVSGSGDSVGLEALIYDRSGSSFHYNTDFSQSPGEIVIFDTTDAGFSKRFVPSTIGDNGTATLRFTIYNPNPVTVSGYNFRDLLPEGMEVADPANDSSTCAGTITTGTNNDTGRDFIEFEDGVIGPNSTCTIRVNVTVATAGSYFNESDNLFIGDVDTGKNATATLDVTAEPPPPLVCIPLNADGERLAQWTNFNSATAPAPTYEKVEGIASASSGSPTAGTFSATQGEWRFATGTNRNESQAITAGAYFEFRVNTTGVDSVNFSLTAWAQNRNAPQTIRLYYGPAGSLEQSIEFTVPQQSDKPTGNNFVVNDLTDYLNDSGETVFRVYMYNGSGNSPLRIDDVTITGKGEICTPLDENETPPDPPELAKAFDPAEVRVGEQTTLNFTLTNPNTTNALTGVTFRDELPEGMTVVENSFENDGCGGTWGLENENPSILLFTGGTLAADSSCTLSVDVISTSIGENLNLSDPIDARETLAGNSAEATLDVLPPPATPSIVKFFDPNPLLDPDGSTTLTFRITNNDPDLGIEEVAFNDVLPAIGEDPDVVQMVPVSPFVYTHNNNCGVDHSFTWADTTNTLSFSGGAIAAGEVCEITLAVKVPDVDVSEGPVAFENVTSRVSHEFNGTTYEGNIARATLVVDNPIPGIALRKEVGLSDDPDGVWSDYTEFDVVPPGQNVYYRFTIENIGETALTDITLSDEILRGLLELGEDEDFDCDWPETLPVADVNNVNNIDHIAVCILGPILVDEYGLQNNTATVSAKEKVIEGEPREVEDGDFANYRGNQPTAITLAAFAATPQGDAILVTWETASELDNLGFNLYRSTSVNGPWEQLNSKLIAPRFPGSVFGGAYQWLDTNVEPGITYYYRLEDVETTGVRTFHGPVSATIGSRGDARIAHTIFLPLVANQP